MIILFIFFAQILSGIKISRISEDKYLPFIVPSIIGMLAFLGLSITLYPNNLLLSCLVFSNMILAIVGSLIPKKPIVKRVK